MSAAQSPSWEILSDTPGIAWPAIPSPPGAAALALLHQLEASQWLAADALRALQFRQLEVLLRHAWETVPFYRERWDGCYEPALPLTAERFAGLPLLSRRDLQLHGAALRSGRLPAGHGIAGESRTSGSTGAPASVSKTQLTELIWNTLTLREHRWHRRDPGAKLAVIRSGLQEVESAEWGSATRGLVVTGPAAGLDTTAPVARQLEWLRRQEPAYLLTYASNAAALARASIAAGIRLPSLREVRTMAETISPELRDLCREAWGAKLTDMYSAAEIGYIALQCPAHAHYHVQCESVLLELLDEHGAPSTPGRAGRVVLTDLHNFAMPLVRYEIGDYAEAGAPCACGRGLPVLSRIAGRLRHMLVAPDGQRYWPSLATGRFIAVAPVLQHQFVQKNYGLIEARLVTAAPLTPQQEAALRALVLARLPPGLRLEFVYCDAIGRGPGGKFEEFISEVAEA